MTFRVRSKEGPVPLLTLQSLNKFYVVVSYEYESCPSCRPLFFSLSLEGLLLWRRGVGWGLQCPLGRSRVSDGPDPRSSGPVSLPPDRSPGRRWVQGR